MKWLPSLFSVLAMIVTPLTPAIQTAVAAHPVVAVVLSGIVGIVSHFATSPLETH